MGTSPRAPACERLIRVAFRTPQARSASRRSPRPSSAVPTLYYSYSMRLVLRRCSLSDTGGLPSPNMPPSPIPVPRSSPRSSSARRMISDDSLASKKFVRSLTSSSLSPLARSTRTSLSTRPRPYPHTHRQHTQARPRHPPRPPPSSPSAQYPHPPPSYAPDGAQPSRSRAINLGAPTAETRRS
jgi:hypothetical protein